MPVAGSDHLLHRPPQRRRVGVAVRDAHGRDPHRAAVGEGAAGEGEVRRQAGLLHRDARERGPHHALRAGRDAPVVRVVPRELRGRPRRVRRIGAAAGDQGGGDGEASVGVVRVHAAAPALRHEGGVLGGPRRHEVAGVVEEAGDLVRRRLAPRHEGAHGDGGDESLHDVRAPRLLGDLADYLGREALHRGAQGVADHQPEHAAAGALGEVRPLGARRHAGGQGGPRAASSRAVS
mmetsp:Transcript_15386/g.33709  ORF Transcript_15386/g.33709 Transcript_15386/m.33709 type:complete len:235 (-) Transcript_15386:8-712(-)